MNYYVVKGTLEIITLNDAQEEEVVFASKCGTTLIKKENTSRSTSVRRFKTKEGLNDFINTQNNRNIIEYFDEESLKNFLKYAIKYDLTGGTITLALMRLSEYR